MQHIFYKDWSSKPQQSDEYGHRFRTFSSDLWNLRSWRAGLDHWTLRPPTPLPWNASYFAR